MLIDVDVDRVITKVPHEPQFHTLRKRLSDAEFATMVARVDELIDAAGGEIATAGWLPASDWTATPSLTPPATLGRGM